MIFAFHSLFLLPPILGGKRKGEKNNQSRDFKSCLSARNNFFYKKVPVTIYNHKMQIDDMDETELRAFFVAITLPFSLPLRKESRVPFH